MNVELLMWLEQIAIWRLRREHSPVKQEDPQSEDETTIVSYPTEE